MRRFLCNFTHTTHSFSGIPTVRARAAVIVQANDVPFARDWAWARLDAAKLGDRSWHLSGISEIDKHFTLGKEYPNGIKFEVVNPL